MSSERQFEIEMNDTNDIVQNNSDLRAAIFWKLWLDHLDARCFGTHSRTHLTTSVNAQYCSGVQSYIMETMDHVLPCSFVIAVASYTFKSRPQTCFATVNKIFSIGQALGLDRQARAIVSDSKGN